MDGEFFIDSLPVPFTEGQTIMDAALAAGLYIPHLCHNPEFHPHGSCRVCTVDVDGRPLAACITPAREGIRVESNTEAVNIRRRHLLEMLFVEGNHVCPACEKSGSCKLQAVAYHVGMLAPEFTYFYPLREVDASHEDVWIDFDRCIMCELCVRASRDVDGKNIFTINDRGIGAHLVIDSPTGKLGDTDFSADDKAAQVCPTGAILPKHKGYETPIGQRLYDRNNLEFIHDVAGGKDRQDG